MKGQQITPWSIYNEHKEELPLPIELPPDKQTAPRLNLPKINRRASSIDYRQAYEVTKNHKKYKFKTAKSTLASPLQQMSNIEEEQKDQDVKSNNKRQASTLKELLEKNMILALIKKDLKLNRTQSILVDPCQALEAETKLQVAPFPQPQPHPFQLQNLLVPRKDIKMPKITSFKECVIQNYSLQEQYPPSDKDLQQELVHKLLKQRIEAMISEKMKVMSHKKQILSRDMVYNFSYKNF